MSVRKSIFGLFISLIAFLFLPQVEAATLYVNGSVGGPGTGTIGDPFQSIQDAIDVGTDNEIQVAGGVYPGSIELSVGTQLLGGFAPGFGSRDIDANVTTIDGQDTMRCILANVGTTNFLVDGFNIISGSAYVTLVGEDRGAGFRVLDGATGVVSNCTFDDCHADSGGAIAVEGDGFDLLVSDCTITNCTADDDAGAIKFDNGDSILVVDRCVIANCSGGDDGGAVKTGDSTGPIVTISNTLFLNNSGGDESVVEGRFETHILNCTFVGNTAPDGDGVVVERTNDTNAPFATMELVNNIFVDNVVNTGGAPVFFVREAGVFGSGLTTTNNLVFNNTADGGAGFALDGRLTGNGNFSDDPAFVDAPNDDYHLEAGSPAIDAGADLSAVFTLDLDGDTRPDGAAFDIGAYEGGTPLSVPQWELY